jgi:DMSO/TMAO reductase YedYZ heme-binding membrane subunit
MSIGDYYASTAALLPVVVLAKTASHAVTVSYRSPEDYNKTKLWGRLHKTAFVAAALGVVGALYGAYWDEDSRPLAVSIFVLVFITVLLLVIGMFHEDWARRKRTVGSSADPKSTTQPGEPRTPTPPPPDES